MDFKRSVGGLLIAVTLFLLSGCLLTRVYAFKEQFCDYRENFQLLVADEISLQMHHPVLLDGDVIWLLGAKPTQQAVAGDRLEMVYVVEKDLRIPDPQYAIPLRLIFTRSEGNFRLSEGVIDKNLGAMITPGLIEETVAHTCDSKTSVLAKNVTVDLSDLDPDAIPRRSEIEEALGEPTETRDGGRVIDYRFRLQGADPDAEKSHARVWFAADGKTVERVRFRYLRYQLDADFVAGLGVISIDL